MAFKPINFDSGKVLRLPLAASVAAVKNKLLKYSSGYLTNAADGDNEVEYLSLETVTDATAGDGGTYVSVLPIDGVTLYEALVSATPVQATHVGNDYDLDDDAIIKLSATTDKVFHIDKIKSAGDLIVIGHFNKPAIA
jgi:hypothetical protein